ncbi:MAG: metallophosphoesterase [bacterium]|nr:metallophosphoesterase [bacterium]
MLYLFAIIALITLILIFFTHYLIFHIIVKVFGITSPVLVNVFRTAAALLPLSFILASILINRFNNFFVRLFYATTSTWLGFLTYFFLACVLFYAILYSNKLFSLNLNHRILIIALFTAAAAIGIYGLFAADNVKIKTLDIALPNLPEAWRGKTAVFISDLHLGAINNYEFADRLAEQINGLNPDLLFIGGDFFDGQKNIDLNRLARSFGRLNAPAGKFFITGNHEEFGDNSEFITAITGAGIISLNNQLIDLNGLQIIGLDYRDAYSRQAFSGLLAGLNIDKNKPSILLRHVPDKIEVAREAGISLMLSGHSHKGQLFPIQLIEILFYDGFQYGLKNAGSTQVYTTSGAGVWGPPMRVLADPEIVVIKFK